MVFALFMKEMAAQTGAAASLSLLCLVFYLLLHPVESLWPRLWVKPTPKDDVSKTFEDMKHFPGISLVSDQIHPLFPFLIEERKLVNII